MSRSPGRPSPAAGGEGVTIGPSRSRSLAVAMAASVIHGSAACLTSAGHRSLSHTNTPCHPAASASAAAPPSAGPRARRTAAARVPNARRALVVVPASTFGAPVRVRSCRQARQLLGAAERDAVAAISSGDDPEPLGHHPPQEPGREEPILGAHHEPRDGGPRTATRAVVRHRIRNAPGSWPARRGHGHVVVEGDERVVAAGHAAITQSLLLPAWRYRVFVHHPPGSRQVPEPCQRQNQRADRTPIGNKRRCEPAIRVGNHDDIPAVAVASTTVSA